jgi:protein sidekick
MLPFKQKPPETLRVKAGHAAVFDLPEIESVPEPAVTWQAEDNTLLYGAKYAVTSTNKLVILSADSSDQKKYR